MARRRKKKEEEKEMIRDDRVSFFRKKSRTLVAIFELRLQSNGR